MNASQQELTPFDLKILDDARKWFAEDQKTRVLYWLDLISKMDGFSPPTVENKTRLLDLLAKVQASLSALGGPFQTSLHDLAIQWNHAPSEFLSWWCGRAEFLFQKKTFPSQPFLDLLVELIDRHAALNRKSPPKKLFWRNGELQRMIRTIKPAKTRRWELQRTLDNFKNHLIDLSLLPTPKLTKLGLRVMSFTDSKRDEEVLSALTAFIHDGVDNWNGDYTFPLSVVTQFNSSVLGKLTREGKAHKKISLFALRHDLQSQWKHDEPQLVTAITNKEALFKFILMLGDFEFAKEADTRLRLHDPNYQSIEASMRRLNTARKNRKARPSDKRRNNFFIKSAPLKTYIGMLT